MNILLTSAGRRTSLLKAFKEECHKTGGKVFAGDIDGFSSTLFLADYPLSYPLYMTNTLYQPFWKQYKNTRSVWSYQRSITVPVYARWQEEFAKVNCRLLVSTADWSKSVAINGKR